MPFSFTLSTYFLLAEEAAQVVIETGVLGITEGFSQAGIDTREDFLARELLCTHRQTASTHRLRFEQEVEAFDGHAGTHKTLIVTLDGSLLGLREVATSGHITHAGPGA